MLSPANDKDAEINKQFLFSIDPQSCQNIWNKIEKSSKTGQAKKSLIATFPGFFDCYCQSLISARETGY